MTDVRVLAQELIKRREDLRDKVVMFAASLVQESKRHAALFCIAPPKRVLLENMSEHEGGVAAERTRHIL